VARRLPAEVLFDSIHAVTGSPSKLPGLPVGARAAQLLDSNVELPGGFLELLGKPVRESVCECERSNSMMLGPVLAFVSGPVVGDAVQDQESRLAKFVTTEKNDARVVEEIYLSVLARSPTELEKDSGMTALRSAGGDHVKLLADAQRRKGLLDAYNKTLDDKQAKWEKGLLGLKPTAWTVLTPKLATSKAGATPPAADKASKLAIQADGSILATGPIEVVDTYTVQAELTSAKTPTAFRLEALSDPSLPKNGPGRAENGNFVLNDLKANFLPLDKPKAKEAGLKFESPVASHAQTGFPIRNAIDNDAATGWAIAPRLGENHAAIFFARAATAVSPFSTAKGVLLSFTLDHRFGTGHTLGKFRFSYTTDAKPRLGAPVPAEILKLLEVPLADRTPKQSGELRAKYLAQDVEYSRLKAEADKVPPSDARVLGAQDLIWALLNSPAFLFNR